MFKTICVDHVGIACKDLDLSKKFYTEVLGLSCTGEEAVPEQGVKTVFIPCGETLLELLVDITENGDGPIGKYFLKQQTTYAVFYNIRDSAGSARRYGNHKRGRR